MKAHQPTLLHYRDMLGHKHHSALNALCSKVCVFANREAWQPMVQ